jgi:hypothetical protein
MRWTKIGRAEGGGFDIPDNWLHTHYYDAVNALFRIENALRTFVYVILKSEFRSQWQDLFMTSDDGGNSTIAATAKKRFTQDQQFGYLGVAIRSPLAHLSFGEASRSGVMIC